MHNIGQYGCLLFTWSSHVTRQTILISDILDHKKASYSPVFRPPFEYRTIWQPNTNLPFEYQTSPVLRWLLYLKFNLSLGLGYPEQGSVDCFWFQGPAHSPHFVKQLQSRSNFQLESPRFRSLDFSFWYLVVKPSSIFWRGRLQAQVLWRATRQLTMLSSFCQQGTHDGSY